MHGIRVGEFQANGATVKLPDGLDFLRTPVTTKYLEQQLGSVSINPSRAMPARVTCLNDRNFHSILGNIRTSPEGYMTYANTFSECLDRTSDLRVTGPLIQDQWLKLVARIKQWQESSGKKVTLWVDTPKQQPDDIRNFLPPCTQEPAQEQPARNSSVSSAVQLQVTQGPFTLESATDESATVFDITPDSQLSSLVYKLRMTSWRERHFDVKKTHFLEELLAGRRLFERDSFQSATDAGAGKPERA